MSIGASAEAQAVADSELELAQLERAVEGLPISQPDDDRFSSPPSDFESLATLSPSPEAQLPNDVSNIAEDDDDVPLPGTLSPPRAPRPIQLDQGRSWQLEDLLSLSGQSLGAVNSASSAGFSFARTATALSLNIAKRVTQVAVQLPAMAIDAASGTPPGSQNSSAAALAHASVGGFFDLVSTLALGGIDLGSALTTAGLGAASTGIEGLRRTLGSEVIRALGQFVKLVQREWNVVDDCLPPGGIPRFGITGVTRALVVWACIQMVTAEEEQKKMLKELDEFDIEAMRKEIDQEQKEERGADETGIRNVRITSETTQREGDVIGAEIGTSSPPTRVTQNDYQEEARVLSTKEGMQGLLRYSSLVLAVYGGTALAWLGALPQHNDNRHSTPSAATTQHRPNELRNGAPLPSDGLTREQDEESFLRAAAMMDLTEDEREEADRRFRMPGGLAGHDSGNSEPSAVIFAADDAETAQATAPGTPGGMGSSASASVDTAAAQGSTPNQAVTTSYSYLNLLAGHHDEELFHRAGGLHRDHVTTGSYVEQAGPDGAPTGASSTDEERSEVPRPSQPRYYIVTDHKARKIILILRGSLTLGDIAADLTCESREFYFPDSNQNRESSSNGQTATDSSTGPVPFPATEASTSARSAHHHDTEVPLVHEGMYETALGVGSIGRPVHRAVRAALEAQPGYALDLAGHSLGAGVAAVLAMLWADPETTLTTRASGLPPGHRVHAYCFGVPCVSSDKLGRRLEKLITSYVYSYDLVCRLSLGSIQDIRNACAWILWEDQQSSRRSTNGNAAFDPSDRSTPLRVAALLTKAFEHQSGRMKDPEERKQTEDDFLALRRTLEANMRNVHLFPPGQVIYLFKGGDLSDEQVQSTEVSLAGQATTDQQTNTSSATSTKRQRAFVLRRSTFSSSTATTPAAAAAGQQAKPDGKIENVFGQIAFSRKLLSCHMPQHYDLAIRGLE